MKNRIWLLLDLCLGMRVLGKEIYMKKTRINLYRKVNLDSRSSLIKICFGGVSVIRFSYPVFLSLASKSKHFITALYDKERLQLLTKFIPNLKNPNMPEE